MRCLVFGKMKPAVSSCILVFAFAVAACAADEQEYDATSLNALRSGMPDPAVVEARDGSGYYVYTTGHGVKVFHSTDLKSWGLIGTVFDRHVPQWAEDAIPGCDGIWAPDIRYFNGRYHLYYSVYVLLSLPWVSCFFTSALLAPSGG